MENSALSEAHVPLRRIRRLLKSVLIISLCYHGFLRAGSNDVLLIHFSDSHSNLPGLVQFLKVVSHLAHEHLLGHPEGEVIIVPTGDIAGADEWSTRDGGEWVYRALAELGRHYPVVTVLGNHEAFDFVGTRFERGHLPNHFFVEQSQRFQSMIGQKLLAANVHSIGPARDLIDAYQDVRLKSGHLIRFIGLVTPNLIASSGYDTSSALQLFDGVEGLLPVAQKELIRAAHDRVHTAFLPVHEELLYVRPFVDELARWKQSRPDLRALSMPLVMAGHDHLVSRERRSDVNVIDSGSDFAFTAIQYDPDQRVVSRAKHWSLEKQEALVARHPNLPLESGIQAVIAGLEREIADVIQENSQVLIPHPIRIEDAKQNLERGPTALGRHLADALSDWAYTQILDIPDMVELDGVIAFFNSTSFRREVPFEGQSLRLIDLRSFIPFDMFTRLRILRGEDIEIIFSAIRRNRAQKQAYSPQLSNGWSEQSDYKLYFDGQPIRPEGLYLLASDHFISRNGYAIPEVEAAFERAIWTQSETWTILDVMRRYLPRRLGCESAFLTEGEG